MINPLHLFYPIDRTTTNPHDLIFASESDTEVATKLHHIARKNISVPTSSTSTFDNIAHAAEENHLIATTILENATFIPPIARTWQKLCSQVSADNDDIAKLDRLFYAISHHYKNDTREVVADVDSDFQHMINSFPV